MKPHSEKSSVLYDSMSRANMSHAVKVIKVKNLRVVQIVRNPQVREVNITFDACKRYAKKMNTMFAIADIGRMYVGM
jgi:hypothetical protein